MRARVLSELNNVLERDMTYIVLDIGAGSLSFGKELVHFNPHIPMLVLCGEPEWGIGPFFKALKIEKIRQLISQGKRGVRRFEASYNSFNLPDSSLDMVTVNSPHPMQGWFFMKHMGNEIKRCLKPGGLLFSSYPLYDLVPVPSDFEKIAEGRWTKIHELLKVDSEQIPTAAPRIFPQSFTVACNMRTWRHGRPEEMESGYMYADGISPRYRLWRKPLTEGAGP